MAIVALVFAGRDTLRAAGSGTTQQDAGLSCKAILNAGLSTGNGIYWIDPNCGSKSDAFEGVLQHDHGRRRMDAGGEQLLPR